MTGKQEVMAKFSRTEIPLGQGKSHRLIPWIIALMVYLGTMALTGAVLLHRMMESWQKDFKSGFTVELQMTSDHPGQSSLEGRQKQDKLLTILRALWILLGMTSKTIAFSSMSHFPKTQG